MYYNCQKNICPHVTFLLPKMKYCVGASKMTQPVKKLAAKANTNPSSILRTFMVEGETKNQLPPTPQTSCTHVK